MGEIRIVGPGKTRGYPYPVCKINRICHRSLMQTQKSQPRGKQIMPETRFAEFPAISVNLRVGFLSLHHRPMFDYFSYL